MQMTTKIRECQEKALAHGFLPQTSQMCVNATPTPLKGLTFSQAVSNAVNEAAGKLNLSVC